MQLASMPWARRRPVGAYAVAAAIAAGVIGAVLGLAGVAHPAVGALILVFLAVAPATAVSALVGGGRAARIVAAIAGPIVVNALVAEAMLVFGVWSPRGGVAAVVVIWAAVLASRLITDTGAEGTSHGAGHGRPSR